MRVLGAIMFIIGIILSVFVFLPMIFLVFLDNTGTESIVVISTIFFIFVGLPCFLLIFFGVRLFRRKKAVPEARPSGSGQHQAQEWVAELNRKSKGSNEQQIPQPSYHAASAPQRPSEPSKSYCTNCGAARNANGGEASICAYCGSVLN